MTERKNAEYTKKIQDLISQLEFWRKELQTREEQSEDIVDDKDFLMLHQITTLLKIEFDEIFDSYLKLSEKYDRKQLGKDPFRTKKDYWRESIEVEVKNWKMRDGIELYDWQKRCLKNWEDSGYRGIAKVVTGAGKTIFALAAIERLQNKYKNLCVSVIVPTIVLLEQWYETIVTNMNVPPEIIGRKGGGHNDQFIDGKEIMLYVINSARKRQRLKKDIEKLSNRKHFLIVDECHRAGSLQNQKIFDARYEFCLGLSATPEREIDYGFEEILKPKLGDIILEYTYSEALEDKIIPPFRVTNVAVLLTSDERREYDALSRKIRDIKNKLIQKYPKELIEDFSPAKLREIQAKGAGDRSIQTYFNLTSQRKRGIYGAKKRFECLLDIIREEAGANAKIIIFHEKIDEINDIFMEFLRNNLPTTLYHSRVKSDRLRSDAIILYRRGVAKIIPSVKALIEGFDVPKTNVGIIAASSSSAVQKIQSLGRILRSFPGKEYSKIYNIYVKDTTDELIFKKLDWDELTGHEKIKYVLWKDGRRTPIEPPRLDSFQKTLSDIKESKLIPGEEYPIYFGRVLGEEYSCNPKAEVFQKIRGRKVYAKAGHEEIVREILRIRPQGGRFKITEAGHVITPISDDRGKIRTIYVLKTQNEIIMNEIVH